MYVDGELADVIPYFELFASVAVDAEVAVPAAFPPPHSVSRLSRACGLSEAQYERTRDLMADVPFLWTVMDPVPGAAPCGELVAYRFPTTVRGRSRIWQDPLVQTLKWVRDQFGVQYPVIRLIPDEWQAPASVRVDDR